MNAPPVSSPLASSELRSNSATTARHIVFLSLLALLVCAPVLVYGLPDWGNDSIEHARWAKNFDIQFWNGEVYPRWLSEVNAGYGNPVFTIYPPMPSYAAAVFWPFVKNSPRSGWYAIGLSCVLATVLSGIGCYFWCRSFADATAALFAGAVYVIMPYHLAVNMFTRGAAGELWAVVWMPFILLAVDGVIRGSKWAPLGLILSYAMLVYTHLPTTLCFSVVPLAAAIFLSDSGKRVRTLLTVAVSMAIGTGLAAPYLLTAALDGKNLYTSGTNTGEFNYHRWWLFQIQPLFDARTRLLLLTLVTMGFLAAASWVCFKVRRADPLFRTAVFLFCVAAGAIFMSSQLSAPIWYLIPLLQGLPFPTRFLQVFGVMVGGVAAMAFPYLRLPRFRIAGAFVGLMVLTWIGGDAWAAKNAFSVWRPFSPQQVELHDKVDRYQRDYPAFWPIWTRMPQVNNFPEFEQFVAQNPPRAMRLTSAAGQQVGAVELESWRPRSFVVKVDAPEPVRLTVNHFYYPGWVGYLGDSHTEIPAAPSTPDGFIQMDLPKGAYLLTVDLEKQFAERTGGQIALGSLLITLGITAWTALRKNGVAAG